MVPSFCSVLSTKKIVSTSLKASQLFSSYYRIHQLRAVRRLTVMTHEDHEDAAILAGIAASLRDGSSHHLRERSQGNDVVDLTADSDDEQKSINASRADIINVDNEEDDEDLKRAIALSMREMNNSDIHEGVPENSCKIEMTDNDGKLEHKVTKEDHQVETAPQPPKIFGIQGLDRKKLEEERLARVAKRKAESSISPPPLRREPKSAKRDVPAGDILPGVPRPLPALTARPSAKVKTASSGGSEKAEVGSTARVAAVHPSSNPLPQFPHGIVKKTWAFGYPRHDDDIKIEEVLQSADLELAILSAFQWDIDWLFTKFRRPETRFLMVMQAKEESTKLQYQEDTASMPNIRLCFPPMDGQVNCMHSKLMLLFHREYLRIVVPSANLVPYDWGEQGGVMENTVFLIDLPKKSEEDIATTNDVPNTPFYAELVYFLKASTIHENMVAKLLNFDFKETRRYAFVHTIGGSHVGNSWRRTGHCGLGRAVSSLGLRTYEPINIDFVTSSIGSLTDEFMRSIYLSAQGDDGSIEYMLRTSKTFPVKPHDGNRNSPGSYLVQRTTGSEWKDRFRVYYPSEQTVSQSKGGFRSAGTICFQEKWFEGPKFPRKVLHDCISRREGLLMHNKMLFVRPSKTITRPDGSSCAGWAYVGSANLSESAWGRIVHDRTRKEPKLNCRNWECGVLIPITGHEKDSTKSTDKTEQQERNAKHEVTKGKEDIIQLFEPIVPVPMSVPAQALGSTLKPWYGAW